MLTLIKLFGCKGGVVGLFAYARHKRTLALDGAESLRFLAYLGVPITEMSYSLNAIEMIKVVNQIEMKQALNFFRAICFFKLRTSNNTSLEAN